MPTCKPATAAVPHPLAPGLLECLESPAQDLNCAKGGLVRDCIGCTQCNRGNYLDPEKNVTLERSAVAAAVTLPLPVCIPGSQTFNFDCVTCTKDGCSTCRPPSWDGSGT